MLRAVRFATRFDFRISPGTASAIRKNAERIADISGERICDELGKMLALDSAGLSLKMLHSLDLAGPILPELHAAEGLWEEAVARVEALAAHRDVVLTQAAMLADLPRPTISKIIRRWGQSNGLRDSLCWMAEHVNDWQEAADWPMARFKRLLGHRDFEHLRLLWAVAEDRQTGGGAHVRAILRRARAIPPDMIAPKPFITGANLKAMGLKEGEELGRIVDLLYDRQLNEELTTRKAALAAARRMVGGSDSHRPRGRS